MRDTTFKPNSWEQRKNTQNHGIEVFSTKYYKLRAQWGLLAMGIWREISEEDNKLFKDKIKEVVNNEQGINNDFVKIAYEFLKFSNSLSSQELSPLLNKLFEKTNLNELLDIAGKYNSYEGRGTIKLVNTFGEQRALVYLLNNIGKDILLIYLGIEINEGSLDSSKIQVDRLTNNLPKDLEDPSLWKLRWNLKDRVWVLETKLGNKYILREQKSPYHNDHDEGEPLNLYSQPVIDEASKADGFALVKTKDYILRAEKPLVAVNLHPGKNQDGYQFAIYEYEEGVKLDLDLADINRFISNEREDEGWEYKIYIKNVNLIGVKPLTFDQYKLVKLLYLVMIAKSKMLLNVANRERSLSNTDKDGYSVKVTEEGKVEYFVFDFEKTQNTSGVVEIYADSNNDTVLFMQALDKSMSHEFLLGEVAEITNQEETPTRQEAIDASEITKNFYKREKLIEEIANELHSTLGKELDSIWNDFQANWERETHSEDILEFVDFIKKRKKNLSLAKIDPLVDRLSALLSKADASYSPTTQDVLIHRLVKNIEKLLPPREKFYTVTPVVLLRVFLERVKDNYYSAEGISDIAKSDILTDSEKEIWQRLGSSDIAHESLLLAFLNIFLKLDYHYLEK